MSSASVLVRHFAQLCALAGAVSALPLQNITLPLPLGTSNHGTPGLLCTPTKWTDVILFYLFNYVAHAATVLTRPGERSDDFMVSVIGSLLFPALGLYRGIEAILSGAVFVRNDDLKKAARSGALCIVVRGKDWRPVEGDAVGNAVFRRAKKETLSAGKNNTTEWLASGCEDTCDRSLHVLTYSPPWLKSRFRTPIYVDRQIIHGRYSLPQGYRFAIVPADAQFITSASPNATLEVSATCNFVKALIALVQSGYALLTLYRSRGDQITQFGYAAFGLTVAPYAVMSVMNLLGNLCRPDYASLYMVENGIMDEARKRGGVFEGTVARVREESTTVCACGLADAEDAEYLHFFTNGDGALTATFGVTIHPQPSPPLHRDMCMAKGPTSVCAPLSYHSHMISPLPAKLNYAGTDNDALLLIPCCNPITRGSRSAPHEEQFPPQLYRLSSLTLTTNPCWPFFKHRDWCTRFTSSTPSSTFHLRLIKYLVATIVALTPLAVYGGMSRFQSGSIPHSESSTWKAYTMQWLITGVFSGTWWVVDQEGKDARLARGWQFRPVVRMCLYIISASPAVGGFIVVGQMLARYGVCVWVGG